MDNPIIIGIILFGVFILLTAAVLVFVIGLLNFFMEDGSPVHDRLMALKQGTSEGRSKRNQSLIDELKKMLIKISEPIARSLYGQNKKFQEVVRSLLTEAGLPDNDNAVWKFMAIRIATGLVLGFVFGFLMFIFGMGLTYSIGGLIFGMLFGGMFSQMRLRSMAAKRKSEITFTLSDTLDLMVVCVEAGLGLDATIKRVGEETERMAPELSYEFKRVSRDLNGGISRTEAFHNLGKRSGAEELKSLCALIIQSDKLGTSIAETLRIYAEDVRTKRKQKAEEQANQASVKMTFPLVLFVFPPLFYILLGPSIISSLHIFF